MSLTNEGFKIASNSGEERSILYEKGLQFKRSGSLQNALQCFLSCLQDMKENINFPELPECLHNIAEIYSEIGEYEKAIEFAQAEKLFYETALIQTEKQSEGEQGDSTPELIDPNASSEEALRANEYEGLSQMCLKMKKIQLALEYAGKATQLRKKVYGDSHLVTSKSVDLFTMIYAEMGKQQYSVAMSKMSDTKEPPTPKLSDEPPLNEDNIMEDQTNEEHKTDELQSIKEDESFFDDQNPEVENLGGTEGVLGDDNKDSFQSEEKIFARTFFIYFLLTILTSVLITTVVCYILDVDLTTLHSLLQQKLKFYYYYYFKAPTTHSQYM